MSQFNMNEELNASLTTQSWLRHCETVAVCVQANVDFLQLMVAAEAQHEDVSEADSAVGALAKNDGSSDAWQSSRRGI